MFGSAKFSLVICKKSFKKIIIFFETKILTCFYDLVFCSQDPQIIKKKGFEND